MLIAERIRSDRLAQIIKDMNRHRFGRRAEALPADQLLLALEEVEQDEAEAAAEAEAKSPPMREGASASAAPIAASASHLPEIETIVDVGRACPCCGGELHRIGEEVGRKLDIVPVQFRVLVVRRATICLPRLRRRCRAGAGAGAIYRGWLPTEATVAHVLVSKYADHLPLYGQANLRAAGHSPRPLDARRLGRPRRIPPAADPGARFAPTSVLDEIVRRRDDGAGARSRKRADEDRAGLGLRERRPPLGGTQPPAVAYVYAPDRTASQPITHLAGFKGVLQVDGYAGYRVLAQKGNVSLAFCWSHVRRRFYDRVVAEASPIAHEALQRVAQLYAIEKDIRGRVPDERCAVRQERSRPIVAELEPWLRASCALISKKSSSPRLSAMRSPAGRDFAVSSTTVGSRSFQYG